MKCERCDRKIKCCEAHEYCFNTARHTICSVCDEEFNRLQDNLFKRQDTEVVRFQTEFFRKMNLELWVVKIESGTGLYQVYETTLKDILVDLTMQGRLDVKRLTTKVCVAAIEDYKDFYQCEICLSRDEARAVADEQNLENAENITELEGFYAEVLNQRENAHA